MAKVLVMRNRAYGKARAEHVASTGRRTLHRFVLHRTRPGATLYTDDNPAYRKLPDTRHAWVTHSAGEYVRDPVHTNGVESINALIKRAMKSTSLPAA